MSTLKWWNMNGGASPQLQCLAIQVLSKVVNTSSIERCWSTYSFIHRVKRNRLNVSQEKGFVVSPRPSPVTDHDICNEL
jgi:hypothetical protein